MRLETNFQQNKTISSNSIFEIGRVSYSEDCFLVAESSVLRIKICTEKPAIKNL